QVATDNGRTDAVVALREHGAAPDTRTVAVPEQLHAAARSGSTQRIEQLVAPAPAPAPAAAAPLSAPPSETGAAAAPHHLSALPARGGPAGCPAGRPAARGRVDAAAPQPAGAASAPPPGPTLDVDARDADGRTPLHTAAAAGQREVVVLLLQKGAAVDAAA